MDLMLYRRFLQQQRAISIMWRSWLLFVVPILPALSAMVGSSSDFKREGLQELKSFQYCIRQALTPSLSECFGRSALNFIQRFDERENFTVIEDIVTTKDDTIAARSLTNVLDTDPVDFRGILENAGAVFSQRSMEWHMDKIYPGLMLKIGPTADANSLVEFALDNSVADRQFGFEEEPSTARVLTKQYLLPFLLGLKFNLVALVPLLFAGICLLLKKALFFAKLAIYVSTFLGLGGALSTLTSLSAGGPVFGGFNNLASGFGGLGGALPGIRPPIGVFPGKTTVFTNYDELHHNDPQAQQTPYKRADRKMKMEQPYEYAMPRATESTPTSATTAINDRFYEFEKKLLLQERSSPNAHHILGPTAKEENTQRSQFKTSESGFNGWHVVNLPV